MYLEDEIIFSRYEQRKFPVAEDIIPAIRSRLFGAAADGEAEQEPV